MHEQRDEDRGIESQREQEKSGMSSLRSEFPLSRRRSFNPEGAKPALEDVLFRVSEP